MNKRQTIIIISSVVGLLLIGALVMNVLSAMKPEPTKPMNKEVRRLVTVREVKNSDITSSVIAPGRLGSTSNIKLVAEASGKIEAGAVPLKTGQKFAKGQVLCSIYKDETELALKASKANFLTALANADPDIKIDFPDSYAEFSKFFQSIDIEKPLPELFKIKQNKMKIYLASRNILSTYYQIKQAEKALERYTIYAPFSGTYANVMAEVGTYTNMGGQIANILRTDNLEMEVPVETFLSEWIKVGDKVEVYAKSRMAKTTGSVIRKSDFVDENTQSRTIYIRINQSSSLLLAGEYLMAEFEGGTIKNAVEIPRNCLFNSNEVFVVQGERLVNKEVEIIKTNDKTAIVKGLEDGEILVVQALINVEPNTLVNTINE